jgi:hypothetical protein
MKRFSFLLSASAAKIRQFFSPKIERLPLVCRSRLRGFGIAPRDDALQVVSFHLLLRHDHHLTAGKRRRSPLLSRRLPPTLTLKDAKGGIATVFVDEALNVRDLPVADPGKATPKDHKAQFALPLASDERARLLKPGEYDVYVSVGTLTGTPKLALPLPADDGHHRYRLGKLTVRK